MWERFSFYGMKAFLVLFAADSARGGLGWSEASASRLMSVYGFMAYGLPVLGGFVADRFLGTHRSLVIGACIIAAGHFIARGAEHSDFFAGLALVALGTGFFKVNASTMVGQLYEQGDRRRDAGFTIFYMGVNAGAFLGQTVCGYLAMSPRWGWHWGFGAAGVGMLLGLATYLALRHKYLAGIGDVPNRVAAVAERPPSEPLTREERDRLIALLVVFAFTIVFWAGFEQTATSLNFFAENRTDRMVGGFSDPGAVVSIGEPRRARDGRAAVRRAVDGAGAAQPRAEHARQDGGGAGADGDGLPVHGVRRPCRQQRRPGEPVVAGGRVFVPHLRRALSVAHRPVVRDQAGAGQDRRAADGHVVPGDRDRRIRGRSARRREGLVQHAGEFHLMWVIVPVIAAGVLLALTPWLRRRMHGRDV